MLYCLSKISRFNFSLIAEKNQELMELSVDSLIELLSNDELNVKSDEIIFEIIIKWIDANSNERRKVRLSVKFF